MSWTSDLKNGWTGGNGKSGWTSDLKNGWSGIPQKSSKDSAVIKVNMMGPKK